MASWLEDITTALSNLGGIAHYDAIYKEVKRIRTGELPESWKKIIQRTIQDHSSDSNGFRGIDLLYNVKGIGSGVWGLRSMLAKTPMANDIEESEIPERVQTETYRILRDTALARKIKLLYKNQCQLCGLAIILSNGQSYSEAHHIKPLGRPHNGPDIAENIIVLCPNHHVQFDFGSLKLELKNIQACNGHNIGQQFIDYHNSQIFVSPES